GLGARETDHDIITPYIHFIVESLGMTLRPIRVVCDAGNGTGGLVGPRLLRALGHHVIELFCNLDGTFPNHHPDPTVEANLRDLQKKVAECKADVGIAWDGDADRVGAIDDNGSILWGDQLMIIFSRDVLAERPGAAIVSEVKCSQTLYDDIEKHGGRAIMWKAGHSLIKTKMKEEHALLAGEMSGHIFFRHRYFGFDDGIYSAARLLELVARDGRPLSRMLDGIPRTYASPEIRFDFPEEKKFRAVELAKERLRKHGKTIEVDGVRLVVDGGWGRCHRRRARAGKAQLALQGAAASRGGGAPRGEDGVRRGRDAVLGNEGDGSRRGRVHRPRAGPRAQRADPRLARRSLHQAAAGAHSADAALDRQRALRLRLGGARGRRWTGRQRSHRRPRR